MENNKKKIAIIAIVALAIIGVIGGTLAYFSNKSEFENKFIADQLSVEAGEDFTSPTNWLPGDTTDKIVRAHNTSKLPMAVRISYEERWEDQEGNPLPLEFEGEKAAIVNLDNEDDWIPETKNEQTYYHYYKVLNADEVSSEFMKSVTFNENAIGGMVCTPRADGRGEECKSSTDYEDANYYLNIKIEFIHYDKYKENWDTDIDISLKERMTLYKQVKYDAENSLYGAQTLNTGTLDNQPVYYYTKATNNNVLFGGFCWKIIRTTETGGVKIAYDGTPKVENNCSEKTYDLNNVNYNRGDHTNMYMTKMGYMLTDKYQGELRGKDNLSLENRVYGNSVTYSNGKYTLTKTVSGKYNDLKNRNIIQNYHYSCFNAKSECSTVYYIYHDDGTTSGNITYFTLSNGETIEDVINKVIGVSDSSNDKLGVNDKFSTNYVNKRNSNIKEYIDTWYKNNLLDYTMYLEDTIWCNDRSIYDKGGMNPNGGNSLNFVEFNSYHNKDNLICPRKIDSFTVSEENGNGDLTYPVGLLTHQEVNLTDSVIQYGWTMSPAYFEYVHTYTYTAKGIMNIHDGTRSRAVPAVSLISKIEYTEGNGLLSNPYKIKTNIATA